MTDFSGKEANLVLGMLPKYFQLKGKTIGKTITGHVSGDNATDISGPKLVVSSTESDVYVQGT